MPVMNDEEFARFMTHTEVSDDGCWLWVGSKFKSGYGKIKVRGKTGRTHRLMLARTLGRELGKGMDVLHSCRSRHCCNPDHLREGTRKENETDKIRDETTNRGEKNGQTKLTEEQVRAIQSDPRTHQVIADEYGLCRRSVGNIKSGKTWSHLTST